MFVPYLPLVSISSYVVQGTKETGNIYYIHKHKFTLISMSSDLILILRATFLDLLKIFKRLVLLSSLFLIQGLRSFLTRELLTKV